MNIQDALKMAGINGKIARARELSTDPSFYLMPTNRQKRILMYSDGEQMSIKWEPKFDDLVADDWVVIGQGTIHFHFDDPRNKSTMNIQKALKVGGLNCKIARVSGLADSSYHLMPTNRHSGTLMYADGKQLSILWEPYFDDLVADDWGIIEKGTIPYYFDDYHDKSSRKE